MLCGIMKKFNILSAKQAGYKFCIAREYRVIKCITVEFYSLRHSMFFLYFLKATVNILPRVQVKIAVQFLVLD